MENTDNADQQSPDQTLGNSVKGLSPQHNDAPENDEDPDAVIYTGLGVNNHPDNMNPGEQEAADTLLFTDNTTARHATDEVSNDEEPDEFPTDELADNDLSDDEIEEQITELAEEEDEGNERY